MAEIIVPGPISGNSYGFRIKGDTPTVDEQMYIDSRIRQKETEFQAEYAATFGAPVDTGEGEGVGNYIGEIGKGIARGGIGLFESALLGGAASLPEQYEAPVREGIRAAAYRLKPQTDMGLEETVGGKFGEALGSFGALGLTALLPGGQLLAPTLAIGAGSGEASERARAGGATEEERGTAALLGAPVGALELLPIKFIKVLGKPATGTIINRLIRASAAAGVEGAQEAAATIAQNLIEQGIYNPDLGTFTDTGEALGYGAGVGGLVQGLLDLLPGRSRTATPPATPPATPAAAPPAVTAPPATPAAAPAAPTVTAPPTAATPAATPAAAPATPPTIAAPAAAPTVTPPTVAAPTVAAPTAKGSVRPAQRRFTGPITDSEYRALSDADKDTYLDEIGMPPAPAGAAGTRTTDLVSAARDLVRNEKKASVSLFARRLGIGLAEAQGVMAALEAEGLVSPPNNVGKRTLNLDAAPATRTAVTGLEVLGVDDAIANGVAPIKVRENGKEVPFKNFALSVDGDKAEVGFVERDKSARKGVGYDAYVKLGTELASRGITLQASSTKYAPGQALWNKLEQNGYAKLNPATNKVEFVAPAQTTPDARTATKTEAADVTTAAAAKPEEVGVGAPSGGQGVEGGRRPADDTGGPARVEASERVGLGDGVPDTVGTAAPAGEQPTPLRIDRVDTTQLQGPDRPTRQLIPGTITPVDPLTLQPTGKPYLEASDVYAPDRVIPGAKPTPPGTVLTGSPTEMQVRDAERQLAPMAQLREIAANSAAQSELDAAFDARMANDPELASLVAEYSTPDALVLEDPTTSEDKQKVLALMGRGGVKRGDGGASGNAKTYFSRFKRPIDALDFIVADATLKNQKFKDEEALEAERGALPEGDETVSPVERKFFDGMSTKRAKSALAWVEANMSPQVQDKVRELRRKYKQMQDAKVPNKVTSSLPGSTAVGGRAANAEEKVEFERELVVQTTEAAAKKAEADAMAAAARTRVQGLDNLLAAVQETKEPIKPRAVGMRRAGAETALTKEQLFAKYIAIGEKRQQRATNLPVTYDRPQEVLDLGSALHPAVVNALRNGNLELALRALQLYAPNSRVKRVVRALAPYAQGTSVRIIKDLKDDSGRALAGQYRRDFPGKPSEILLDEDMGLSIETLLHEMVHAATINEMRKPASPLRKRMESLFNDVQPMLSTSNGSSDVMEFMADALSVPSFQQELASLYPNGGPTSALGQIANEIMNLIRRLLGMPQRQPRNALDITDQMVMQMLDFPISPIEISTPQEAATVLNRVAQIDGSFPSPTKEFAQQFGDDASRVLDGASYVAKRGVLGFLNSQSLGDVAGYYKIAGARDLQKAIDQHDAAAIAADSEVDVVLDIGQKWANKNPNLKPLLDRTVFRSTTNQVDPGLPRKKALDKYGAGSDKLREYDAMQKDWAAIGKDGRDLYNNMRQLYRGQYERLRNAIEGKVDFILKDNPELAIEIKKSIYAKFFDLNRIEPYFPLARKGDFWLEYDAFDPSTNTTETVRTTFDSPNARTRAIAELNASPDVVKGPDGNAITNTYTTLDLVQQGRTPDTLFVRDTLTIIQSNLAKTGVDAATASSIQQEITKLFIDALPETAFAKSLQKRQNTPGYIEDALEALRVKGYSLGRQGVRYAYSNKIRAITDAIVEQGKRTDDQSKLAVIAELVARSNFAINPPGDLYERIVQTVNRGAFTFTLGFNVSSAIVNMSSVPVVLYPYLAGRYGPKSAAVEIANAYKIFANSGIKREIELPAEFQGKRTATVSAMPSIDNYYVLKEKRTKGADGKDVVSQELVLRDDIAPELRPMLQELTTLVEVAQKNGQLNRSIYYDSLGIENVGRSRGFSDRFAALGGAAFHQVERTNRQVALISAYNLELARLRNKPTTAERGLTEAEQRTRAAERAVYQATETGGGATLASAPRWAQRGLGRVALMYKNFGLSMFYLQMKLIKQLTLGSSDPDFTAEDRRVAFRQLVGLQLSSFALAGVSGVPLYGLVSMVADAFLDDDEEDADMLTRRYLGEGLYKGYLSEISGLDVSARIGLNGLLIRENRYNTDQSAEEVVLQNLGGPAWSTATQFGRGVSEFYSAMTGGEGDMVRGIENMVPAAVRNFMKAARYMSEGSVIDTRRKDIIVGDLGAGDLLGQALGFTPTKATLQQDINQLKVRISKTVSERRSRLSSRYYIALRVGDIEGAQEALEDIRAFNDSIRSRFPQAIIDPEYLRDSLKGQMRESAKMSKGVSLNPIVRNQLDDLEAMYDQGFQLF